MSLFEGPTASDMGRSWTLPTPCTDFCPAPMTPPRRVLRFIDWYGDTVFNHLQIPSFLAEWATLKPRGQEERSLLDQVAALARRVEGEPHLYLKFYGD